MLMGSDLQFRAAVRDHHDALHAANRAAPRSLRAQEHDPLRGTNRGTGATNVGTPRHGTRRPAHA